MFTIKFMKYGPGYPEQPSHTTGICVRQAAVVHVTYEKNLRAVLQLGDAGEPTEDVTVGAHEAQYNVAYIMNEQGRTVETIR